MEVLTIQFLNELSFKEIPFFRGAILHSLPDTDNLLLHNHVGEGFRYAYPLIQYKSIQGKAGLVCLNEGLDTVMNLLKRGNLSVRIGKRDPETLLVEHLVPDSREIKGENQFYKYHINKWMALNEANYSRYLTMERMIDRIAFLESVLTANVLSFLKGVDVHIEQPIVCELLDVSKQQVKDSKGVKMLTFDACFRANVELPDFIGLGKHASMGYGVIIQEKHNIK